MRRVRDTMEGGGGLEEEGGKWEEEESMLSEEESIPQSTCLGVHELGKGLGEGGGQEEEKEEEEKEEEEEEEACTPRDAEDLTDDVSDNVSVCSLHSVYRYLYIYMYT
jgi:hypothetical protein